MSVHSHMLSCNYIPEELKAELTRLKAIRGEQTSRLKAGSQKHFFSRVWARMHGLPVPVAPSAEKEKKKAHVQATSVHISCDNSGRSHDSDEIPSLVESSSTLSSMSSVDEFAVAVADELVDLSETQTSSLRTVNELILPEAEEQEHQTHRVDESLAAVEICVETGRNLI